LIRAEQQIAQSFFAAQRMEFACRAEVMAAVEHDFFYRFVQGPGGGRGQTLVEDVRKVQTWIRLRRGCNDALITEQPHFTLRRCAKLAAIVVANCQTEGQCADEAPIEGANWNGNDIEELFAGTDRIDSVFPI